MKGRLERLDLLHQRIGEPLARNHRQGRNVVDRLLGIELGALSADLVEDVDKVSIDVEQAEFEHCKKTAGAGADDKYVSLDGIGHAWFLRAWNDEIVSEDLASPDRPAKSAFGQKMQAWLVCQHESAVKSPVGERYAACGQPHSDSDLCGLRIQ